MKEALLLFIVAGYILLQYIPVANFHIAVNAGDKSTAICKVNYSESETSRWKGYEYYGPDKPGNKLVLGVITITSILWFVTILAPPIYVLFKAPKKYKLILTIVTLAYFCAFLLVWWIPELRLTPLNVTVLKTLDPVRWQAHRKKLIGSLVGCTLGGLALSLITIFIKFRIEEEDNQIEFPVSFSYTTILVAITMFVFMYITSFPYINIIERVTINYKQAFVDDGSTTTNNQNLLQYWALQLYELGNKYKTDTSASAIAMERVRVAEDALRKARADGEVAEYAMRQALMRSEELANNPAAGNYEKEQARIAANRATDDVTSSNGSRQVIARAEAAVAAARAQVDSIASSARSTISQDMFGAKIKRYFKTNIKLLNPSVDGDYDSIISDRKNELWKYIFHEDGKELGELVNTLRNVVAGMQKSTQPRTGDFDILVNSINDNFRSLQIRTINPTQRYESYLQDIKTLSTIILKIRQILAALRKNTDISSTAQNAFRTSLGFALLFVALALYGVYHPAYLDNSVYTTTKIAGMTIVIAGIASVTGLTYSAMGL